MFNPKQAAFKRIGVTNVTLAKAGYKVTIMMNENIRFGNILR